MYSREVGPVELPASETDAQTRAEFAFNLSEALTVPLAAVLSPFVAAALAGTCKLVAQTTIRRRSPTPLRLQLPRWLGAAAITELSVVASGLVAHVLLPRSPRTVEILACSTAAVVVALLVGSIGFLGLLVAGGRSAPIAFEIDQLYTTPLLATAAAFALLAYQTGQLRAWVLATLFAVALSESMRRYLRLAVESRVAGQDRERLMATLLDTALTERKQSAGRLHDGPLQDVLASAMRLETILENSPDLDADLAPVVESLVLAAGEMRVLASGDLNRPTDRSSLETLIDRDCQAFEQDFPGGISSVVQIKRSPDAAATLAAYQVVHEALANARKHSRATAVIVRVGGLHNAINVEVVDNGVGLRTLPSGVGSAPNLGLALTRDRVERLGGKLEVASPPHGGTSVRAVLPMSRRGVRRASRWKVPWLAS